MDVLSILGFILAVGLVMFGMTFDQESMRIVYHNLKAFLDIPSMAITIGGTLGVMMISFPAGAFKKIGSHLKIIVKPYQYSPTDSVDQIVNLATEARMKGLLSLEDKLNEIDEPFLHNSLMLVVDSVDSEKVRKAMETELEQLDERHALDRRFYEKAASFAPAFGMIGTLVGLILMLGNMSDVDALAKGMATNDGGLLVQVGSKKDIPTVEFYLAQSTRVHHFLYSKFLLSLSSNEEFPNPIPSNSSPLTVQ